MRRDHFEHVLRAAADVVDDDLIVVGSQAVLAEHPQAPQELLMSMELDIYPRHHPERAFEIDGAIGDGSPFHETYGYYAHGVGSETVIVPAGWQQRLRRVELTGHRGKRVVALCLEMHDLLLAKLAAGRERDYEFVEPSIRASVADKDQLRLGAELMPDSHRKLVQERLEGILARLARTEAEDN